MGAKHTQQEKNDYDNIEELVWKQRERVNNFSDLLQVTCQTLRLQIADVKNDITGMEKVWKDMDEDYMYTKNIAMGVLDRLDFQFEDVKRAVEELKREAERTERFLKNRSKN